MIYEVVFDIADVGYRGWPSVRIGAAFAVAGFLMLMFYRYLPLWPITSEKFKKGFAILCAGFATLWTLIAFVGTYTEYWKLNQARKTGMYEVVEGRVEDFIPMPYGGHAYESFRVGSKTFRYSDYHFTAGFNNTASHGGPIKAGLQVRISHVDSVILRLEVAQ
jgi:hypothetical protein